MIHWLVAAALLAALASGAAAQESPASLVAYVSRVVDGDTIYAMIGNRMEAIRYIGINTPETHHPRLGAQPGGQAATEVNRQLVDGQWVQLTFDVQQRDKYGRLLAYVWINGQMVNAHMVHSGYAQASAYPPNVRYQDYFSQLERGAREGQRGLWGDAAAEPILRYQPRANPRRRVVGPAPAGRRQLLPGEIPPQTPPTFKTEASEHRGSVSVSLPLPSGFDSPGSRCPAGYEFVDAHVREGGSVRAHCRR